MWTPNFYLNAKLLSERQTLSECQTFIWTPNFYLNTKLVADLPVWKMLRFVIVLASSEIYIRHKHQLCCNLHKCISKNTTIRSRRPTKNRNDVAIFRSVCPSKQKWCYNPSEVSITEKNNDVTILRNIHIYIYISLWNTNDVIIFRSCKYVVLCQYSNKICGTMWMMMDRLGLYMGVHIYACTC